MANPTVNPLDIQIEVSSFFPGGEGGIQGSYLIFNAPIEFVNEYSRQPNPGLTFWNDYHVAEILSSCRVQNEIKPLNQVLSNLQGKVLIELCSQTSPNRARFLVYERLYH